VSYEEDSDRRVSLDFGLDGLLQWREKEENVAWRVDRIGFSKDCKNIKRENKERMRRKKYEEKKDIFENNILFNIVFSKFANIKVSVLFRNKKRLGGFYTTIRERKK
jgi:glucan phosphorylase